MADPRLAVTLLVRDEADVIAATIEYYIAQQPVAIIVTDNGSVDATTEILAEYAKAGAIEVIDEPQLDYRQSEWVTRMARRAATAHRADWVINADADEFWTASDRSATLTSRLAVVPADVGIVRAERQDLRYPRWANDTVAWSSRLVWRDTRTVSTAGTPLGLKSAHRGDAEVIVAQGNHDVHGLAQSGVLPPGPIDILHVPLRSWHQYADKIRNGGSAYQSNTELPESIGWHWRSDYARLQSGELEQDVRNRLLGIRSLGAGVLSGRLRHDTWLRHRLQKLLPDAVRPKLLAAALGSD